MPVHNAAETLRAALRSIQWQTCAHWELILIDDGSTDQTLAVARAAALEDARIKVIEGAGNAGLALRLNQAIGIARGGYIARMDADDIAYPQRFATQLEFMRHNPQVDLVGCAALIFDNAGRLQGKWRVPLTHAQICAKPWSRFPVPHPTWLGKREWFQRFGYAPDYKKSQDQDLLLRSHTQSRFACVPDVLLGYRQQRRTLGKLLAGRRSFARSIAREAWRQGAFAAGAQGLAGQVVKAAVDLVTVPLGLDRRLRAESAADVTQAEQAVWQTVWTAATVDERAR